LARTVAALSNAVLAAFYAFAIAATANIATVLVALGNGFASPAAAPFAYFPQMAFVAQLEPHFAYGFIFAGFAGYGVARLAALDPGAEVAVARLEASLGRAFPWLGLPLLVGIMWSSIGALWSGFEVSKDTHSTIAGLIPVSDAAGHLECAFEQAESGIWNPWCERRPIASALRSLVTLLGGFDHNLSILLQGALLASCLLIAGQAVGRYGGVWAMLAFVGLGLVQLRPFLALTMSEGLAAGISLLATACTVECWRRRNAGLQAAMSGLWSLALFVRMGSMLTIPALILWSGWHFRATWRGAALAVLLSISTVGLVAGCSRLLVVFYGTGENQLGSNFATTLFGLSVGGDWNEAAKRHGTELAQMHNEAERAAFLYRKALETIVSQPGVMAHRLWQAERHFIGNLPQFMFSGYRETPVQSGWILAAWTIVVAGYWWNFRARDPDQLIFTAVTIASIILSAPFVVFDDGWRVLVVTHFALALFIALGLQINASGSDPQTSIAARKETWWPAGLVLALVLILLTPALAHRVFPAVPAPVAQELTAYPDDEGLVGRKLGWAGFAVYADGTTLPTHVPALHWSTFQAVMRRSVVEDRYHGLLDNEADVIPPFALLTAHMRARAGHGGIYAVGPAALLERTDVNYWRVQHRWLPHVKLYRMWEKLEPLAAH
jgi:hypothetical protein